MATSPAGDVPIDRVGPTRRPAGWSVMRMRWAHLLFLHWEVPVEALRPLVPAALEIDTYEGRAYVGLVPFTMTGVRPNLAPPVWGLSSFHELNARTYVHHRGRDPGVWFFSLDAAQATAVMIARTLMGLPYHRARMRLERPADDVIDYGSERLWPGPVPARCALRYAIRGQAAPAAVGTLEHFLIERYILYARKGDRLLLGRVHHRPYPVQPAEVLALEEDLLAAEGVTRPAAAPLVHYAAEVRVRVYPPRVVDA